MAKISGKSHAVKQDDSDAQNDDCGGLLDSPSVDAQTRKAIRRNLKETRASLKDFLGELLVRTVAEASGPASRFMSEVNGHLRQLDRKQHQLARVSKISESQFAGWNSDTRVVTRSNVCTIAKALAELYDTDGSGRFGTHSLDLLLGRLLNAAGFSGPEGRPADRVWRRLGRAEPQTRTLRVGWSNTSVMAEKHGTDEEPKGIAATIGKEVFDILGIRPTWIEMRFRDLIPALQSGKIDLTIPFLHRFPTRMFSVKFAADLPGINVCYATFVHKSMAKHAIKIDDYQPYSPKRSQDDIWWNRLQLIALSGGIGETVVRMLNPNSGYESEKSPEDVARRVLEFKPSVGGDELIPCGVLDAVSCWRLQNRPQKDVCVLFGYKKAKVHVPISFGVHPDETRLAEVLSAAINILKESGYFEPGPDSRLEELHHEIPTLRELGVFWSLRRNGNQ